MAIPLSMIVNVGVTVSPTPLALAGFGQLLFVSPEANTVIDETEVVRTYSSMEGVATDFPTGEINAAATSYYAQSPTPLTFMVGGVYGSETSGELEGGATGSLVELQALTDVSFTINVDGVDVAVASADFSGAADFAGIATILQTNIPNTVVGYVEESATFLITSDSVGVGSSIGFAVGAEAVPFGLTVDDGGILTEGSGVDTPAEALTKIDDVNNTDYGIVLDRQYRDSPEAIAVAAWCQARTKIFFNTTNDVLTLDMTDDTCVAAQLKASASGRTLTNYSSTPEQYPSASIAGRAFTVNFEGTNTTITLKFKLEPGITVEELTPSQLAALEDKNANAFMDVGGVSMYSDSRMADGGWFDTVHGTDWLQNRIQTDVFNLLYTSPTKIPYTDEGVNRVVNAVNGALAQGVNNGLIAPGKTAAGDYLATGYLVTAVPVADVSPSDKGNRIYQGIGFEAVGAGALQNINISGTFTS